MKFTPQHREITRTVEQFIEKELAPHHREWEDAGNAPLGEIFKKMGNLGLLGIEKPEAYGGMGLDYSYAMVANEAMGACPSGGVGLAINVQTTMSTPALAKFGTPELCEEFLAPAIAGDMVTSIAVSETHAGSDVAAIKTTAKKDGDDYVINGSKMWITNAQHADWVCLLANTSDDKVHINKSLIVVPTNTPGFEVGEKLNKLGMRSSDTSPIYLDNVRVPQRYRIGQEGMGFMMQMMQFQEERLSTISMVRGMEIAIDKTIEYCRERTTFGQPIIDNQYVHFRLAELKTEVEACRALFYKAAEQMLDGEDVTMLASMAKLKAGRLAREVSDSCLQYWGGNGFMWDNPLSEMYRDCRLASIGGGADEIMLGIICKLMGTLPKKKK